MPFFKNIGKTVSKIVEPLGKEIGIWGGKKVEQEKPGPQKFPSVEKQSEPFQSLENTDLDKFAVTQTKTSETIQTLLGAAEKATEYALKAKNLAIDYSKKAKQYQKLNNKQTADTYKQQAMKYIKIAQLNEIRAKNLSAQAQTVKKLEKSERDHQELLEELKKLDQK